MKKLFILQLGFYLTFCFTVSCKQESKDGISTDLVNVPATASGKDINATSSPIFTFTQENYDFGKITQGEKVSHDFNFKNTGGSNLIISSAQGSCGCTVPQYSKTPVSPGDSGVVNVVFDSEGKSGKVQKTVTLVSNANPNTKVLTISAEIIIPNQ